MVLCPVRLALPTQPKSWTDGFKALVDSGAGRCIFADFIAEELGIDVESGMRDFSMGISGPQESWVHSLHIDLPGGPALIRAAFQRDLPIPGILGMEGFFEHFIVTFDGLARECQLDRIYRS